MVDAVLPAVGIDIGVYLQGKQTVTAEYLQPFWDQQVAWHADGTRIVAAADSHEGLYARLQFLGIDSSTVVLGYVDDPRVVNL
jgi:hypothetical protein